MFLAMEQLFLPSSPLSPHSLPDGIPGSTCHYAAPSRGSSQPGWMAKRQLRFWYLRKNPGEAAFFFHGFHNFSEVARQPSVFKAFGRTKRGCGLSFGQGESTIANPEKLSLDTVREEIGVQEALPCENVGALQRDAEEIVAKKHEAEAVWDVDGEDVKLLAKIKTMYNFVQVLEIARRADHPFAGARILLLDRPGNIQSVYQPYKMITDSYYDVFASLPPLLPEGPLGILGLGAGTAARIIHHFWPYIDMHGWELDPAVVKVARRFFNLSELEVGSKVLGDRESVFGPIDGNVICEEDEDSHSAAIEAVQEDESTIPGKYAGHGKQPGRLMVHVGNALGSKATIEGGFAGLLVDIFSDGAVIPALQQSQTWQRLKERLRPGGRIMVNCGGSCVEAEGENAKDGKITMEETIAAMIKVFPGEMSRKSLDGSGNNSLALTGPTPQFQIWKDCLPDALREGPDNWVSVS